MNPGNIVNAALDHAARGWHIIPLHGIGDAGRCTCGAECSSPGKHPRIKGWQKSASTDAAQIQAWYTEWPNSNIGIVTGPESGLIVLDVDGDDGERSLDGWQ